MNTTTLSVCVDCLFYLANGEVIDGDGNNITEAHGTAMAAVWDESFDITLGSLTCEHCGSAAREADGSGELEDCEPWFSWQQCDGCHSWLGGDRVHATTWTEDRDDQLSLRAPGYGRRYPTL